MAGEKGKKRTHTKQRVALAGPTCGTDFPLREERVLVKQILTLYKSAVWLGRTTDVPPLPDSSAGEFRQRAQAELPEVFPPLWHSAGQEHHAQSQIYTDFLPFPGLCCLSTWPPRDQSTEHGRRKEAKA